MLREGPLSMLGRGPAQKKPTPSSAKPPLNSYRPIPQHPQRMHPRQRTPPSRPTPTPPCTDPRTPPPIPASLLIAQPPSHIPDTAPRSPANHTRTPDTHSPPSYETPATRTVSQTSSSMPQTPSGTTQCRPHTPTGLRNPATLPRKYRSAHPPNRANEIRPCPNPRATGEVLTTEYQPCLALPTPSKFALHTCPRPPNNPPPSANLPTKLSTAPTPRPPPQQ